MPLSGDNKYYPLLYTGFFDFIVKRVLICNMQQAKRHVCDLYLCVRTFVPGVACPLISSSCRVLQTINTCAKQNWVKW